MDGSDMTRGSILKGLFRFFFPVLFGMLFQQLYNTVDAIVVGRAVGHEALAAVGGSPAVIINLVIGFFLGLSSGATVIISQYFGSRDDGQLARAAHTILAFSLLVGAALTVLGWISAPWALHAVKTPEDIAALSLSYLRIFYLGTVPLLLFNVGSGILRAVGDSRWPLVFLVLCCVLNIALDLLFVAGLRWGVPGAAWATVLSLTVSAVCVLIHLARARGAYRLRFGMLRIYWPSLRRILYIGVPAGVQNAMYAVSNIVIQTAINGFGTTTVAAWTAIGKFDGIYWMTSNAFGVSICTFVGQCFGAAEYDRMRRGVRQWMGVTIGTSIALSTVMIAMSRWGMMLFSKEPDVIALATQILWYIMPFYFVWSFIEIISNTLRGVGDSVPPTVISLLGVCLLRVLWVLLVVPRWRTVLCVALSYPVTWAVTAAIFLIYFLRGNWLERSRDRQEQPEE